MTEYLDKNEAVDEGYLSDWYIHSLVEYDDERLNEPRWTEEHIEELTNDFIVIPKDTAAADVAPIVHGHWSNEMVSVQDDFGDFHAGYQCSRCNGIFNRTAFCGGCGARMDEEAADDNQAD